MLSKSLIQFSADGQGCVPSLLFDLRPKYGGGNKDNGDLLQKVPCTHCYTQCPNPEQVTADPHLCQRLLDTHRQVWVILLRGHFSFLLGPDVHKISFMPSKRWLYGGVMLTSSKRAYAIPRSTAPRASASAAVHC